MGIDFSFQKSRIAISLIVGLFLIFSQLGGIFHLERSFVTDVQAASQHDYFNALIARPDFYKGYSLRPTTGVSDPANPYYEKQLLSDDDGGLHASDCSPSITYNPGSDTDPHAQDAAKSPIPAFQEPGVCKGQTITQPVAAKNSGENDVIYMSAVTSTYGPPGQRQVMIENEILEIRACTTAEGGDNIRGYVAAQNKLCVQRGMYGTNASFHAIGIKPKVSNNQINNYLRPRIGTSDGNTYFVTWDVYWTDSYLGIGTWDTGQKTFQFTTGGDSKLLEPRLNFSGGSTTYGTKPSGFDPSVHIASVDARAYNAVNTGQATWSSTNGNVMGPGFTNNLPIVPIKNTFIIEPNKWTRWWVRIDQRANDWDYFDLWVADEDTEPVKVYERIPLSIGKSLEAADQSIDRFWFEQANSTTDWLRGDLRDFVSYLRNWVVLKNPGDVSSLLVRPVPGAVAVPSTPDTQAPNISITSPSSGSTVSGTVTISATASDNIGVSGVQFKVNGINSGNEDLFAPYSLSWNTTSLSNGSYVLLATARDSAGNSTTSSQITVTVSNTQATPVPPPPPPAPSPTPNPAATPSPSPTQFPPPSPNPPPVTVSLPVDGTLIKDSGNPAIYIMEFGKKRPFASWDAFVGLGFSGKPTHIMNTSTIPLGQGIFTKDQRHPRGTLVLINGTVYFLGAELKYGFPSLEIFNSWGRDLSEIVPGNPHDSAITNGPVAGIKK